ncbi:hypothetical protein [Actinosynnema sp.]|uniref:hypothetical protein n=1 Tax=Actinosynnema sp. TaxID=1872144 RepID=UPI003F830913
MSANLSADPSTTAPDDACTPEQLTVTAAERRAPVADETLFVIRFTPGEGVTCALRGAPEDLEFLDAGGNALPGCQGGSREHAWPAPVTGPVPVAPIGDEVG